MKVHTVARPKLNPAHRFNDVMPLWALALEDNGAVLRTTEKNAIFVMHRLHMARKAIRDADGMTALDNFVIRRSGIRLEICPRPSIDLSLVTKLDGSPSTKQDAELSPETLARAKSLQEQYGKLLQDSLGDFEADNE